MQRRPSMTWVAGVLAIHLGLLAAFAQHRPRTRAEPGLDLPGSARLILLDTARVSALAAPAAAVGHATRPAPGQPASPTAVEAPPTAHDAASSAATRVATASSPPDAAVGSYRPSSALDFAVRPRSAPDLGMLNGPSWSGVPLRVRLFIDVDGTVVDVKVLRSAEQDDLLQRVRDMFLATGFTPGIENGKPVPCYKDIEINAGPPS